MIRMEQEEGEGMKNLFFQMIRKARRTYLITLMSEVFIIAIIYFSLTVGSALIYVSEREVSRVTPLIFKMEEMFYIPYMLLMFLQILILLDYIRKRSYDYAMLKILGMKKKHRYLFVAGEYVSLILGSVLIGLVIGVLCGAAVKPVLEYIFRDVTDKIIYGSSPLIVMLIVCCNMYGIGFIICDQIISCMGMEYVISGGIKGTKEHKKSTRYLLLIVSLILTFFSFVLAIYGEISEMVMMVIAVIIIGIGLYFGGETYLGWLRKRKKKYYERILWMDSWFERFTGHMNKAFIVAIFLFVMIFSVNVKLVDNLPPTQPENYPYDLVWQANQGDEDFLEQLKDKYHIKYQTISDIRVTSGDHGEHMGMSSYEYERWTGDKIELSDKEIYVIYQNDRSKIGRDGIDFGAYYPDIYFGNSNYSIWISTPTGLIPNNQFKTDYHIVGTENRILTGVFKNKAGYDVPYDAIIIFSDEEFEKISRAATGANLTVLMDISESYDEVVNQVRIYAKEHSQIDFYDYNQGNLIYEKTESLIISRQDKIFQICTNVMNLIILLVCCLMILIEVAESEKEKQIWKENYLSRLGMSNMKRKRTFYTESLITAKIAILGGIPFGLIFMMAQLFTRQLDKNMVMIYLFEGIGMAVLLSVVLLIVMKSITWKNFKNLKEEK